MLAGKASDKEEQLLINYYNSFQQNNKWDEATLGSKEAFETATLQQLKNKITPQKSKVVMMRMPYKIAAAASVILLLASGVWLLLQKKQTSVETAQSKNIQLQQNVFAPQTNRATITLADGKTIYLDSLQNGKLLAVEGVEIDKLQDGKIQYRGNSSSPVYNTLTNPKGSKQIDITLADGTRVWLNAASSITFPVAFIGNERKVDIKGEAYLEVAHDASKPFKVKKGEMEVTVLGTKFNVNTYEDEADMKVTLLEGSVLVNKISADGNTIVKQVKIKPGQQAKFSPANIVVENNVNIEEVMAWKNGFFKFNNTTIETLMRQIEKWYDVDIIYEGKVTSHFVATIPKTVSAQNVFKILEQTGAVHFKIEGKKVIVSP